MRARLAGFCVLRASAPHSGYTLIRRTGMETKHTSERRLGPYKIVERVASGGMAEIYRAEFQSGSGFTKTVAIKKLFSNWMEQPEVVAMFRTEAQLLAHLNHPAIPDVYDVGYAENSWYTAMEFVRGRNLAHLLEIAQEKRIRVPLSVAVGIALQVCEGLHHVHGRCDDTARHLGIVHRDVSPHNIHVRDDGVIKILDFGIAQSVLRLERELGTARGTLGYMSPEQARGRSVDHRADVFSLGIVLFELTTGSRLFQGSEAEVMTAVIERDALAPSSLVAGYPSALQEIVLQALQRDVHRRTPSIDKMRQSLQKFAIEHPLDHSPHAIEQFVQEVIMTKTPQTVSMPPSATSPEPTPLPLWAPVSSQTRDKRDTVRPRALGPSSASASLRLPNLKTRSTGTVWRPPSDSPPAVEQATDELISALEAHSAAGDTPNLRHDDAHDQSIDSTPPHNRRTPS
jgi:serine/threonine protein kinase